MPPQEDFAPILDRGVVQHEKGRRAWLSKRAEPVVREPGAEHVFITISGEYRRAEDRSEGEKYWARAASWIKVDVKPRNLEFEFPLIEIDVRAGFVVDLTVSVAVADAVDVARAGLTGVREYLQPELNRMVNHVELRADDAPRSGDEAKRADGTEPAVLRRRIRDTLDKSLTDRVVPNLPSGLSARVAAVSVRYEPETREHMSDVGRLTRNRDILEIEAVNERTQVANDMDRDAERERRKGEIAAIEAANEDKRVQHDLALRAAVRTALVPHLANPNARIFEAAIADPTPSNILAAAREANAADAQNRESFIDLLKVLVEHDYPQPGDDIHKQLVALLDDLSTRARVAELGSGVRPEIEAQDRNAAEVAPAPDE